MEPYREAAVPEIDRTEIEKERIRQKAETARAGIAQREETYRRMGDGYTVLLISRVIAAPIAMLIVGLCVNGYIEARKPLPECQDDSYLLTGEGKYNHATCSDPRQVSRIDTLRSGESWLRCECRPHTVPAPSASVSP